MKDIQIKVHMGICFIGAAFSLRVKITIYGRWSYIWRMKIFCFEGDLKKPSSKEGGRREN